MKYFQPVRDIDLDGRPEVQEMVVSFLRMQWPHVVRRFKGSSDFEIVWQAVWALTDNQVLRDGTILRWGPQGSDPSAAQAAIIAHVSTLMATPKVATDERQEQ